MAQVGAAVGTMLFGATHPQLAVDLPDPDDEFEQPDYAMIMSAAIDGTRDFGRRLSAMRRVWSRLLLELVVRDIFGKLTLREAKAAQTALAEAERDVLFDGGHHDLVVRIGENEPDPAPHFTRTRKRPM